MTTHSRDRHEESPARRTAILGATVALAVALSEPLCVLGLAIVHAPVRLLVELAAATKDLAELV